MKNTYFKCLLIGFLCVTTFTSQAQEAEQFNRKGRVLLETGYNLLAGFSSGTGLTIFVDEDGETITSLGINGGYFVSQNFALKFNLGLLSANGSLSNVSVGGKYYIAGSVPLEVGLGTISGNGTSDFLGNLSIGYAINLAPNIALEPSLGALISDGMLLRFGFNFAMFL